MKTIFKCLVAVALVCLEAGCGIGEKKMTFTDSLNYLLKDVDIEEGLNAVLPGEVSAPRAKTWEYSEKEDEMDGGKKRWASLQSDNYINMDFPYEGNTYATLCVRYMKKWGTDVYVKIERGQISGNKFNGTNYVRIKFDEGTPVKYTYEEAGDGSPEIVFLRNPKGFIDKAKKAKKIKVEVPLFQEGIRVFDFSVDESLTW